MFDSSTVISDANDEAGRLGHEMESRSMYSNGTTCGKCGRWLSWGFKGGAGFSDAWVMGTAHKEKCDRKTYFYLLSEYPGEL